MHTGKHLYISAVPDKGQRRLNIFRISLSFKHKATIIKIKHRNKDKLHKKYQSLKTLPQFGILRTEETNNKCV